MKAVRKEEVKLWGVGFVKRVGFKPEVKERESVMDEQSGESEEEVMREGIGKVGRKWRNWYQNEVEKR